MCVAGSETAKLGLVQLFFSIKLSVERIDADIPPIGSASRGQNYIPGQPSASGLRNKNKLNDDIFPGNASPGVGSA